jgi:hypothetical protein
MDAETFKVKTGRQPENDDLERVTCDKAGTLGHMQCGWCLQCDLPVYECGHTLSQLVERFMRLHELLHMLHQARIVPVQMVEIDPDDTRGLCVPEDPTS